MRLVARVDEVLPGETITPAASQVRGATLVVAHLEYARLPPPEKDQNTRRDIKATDDVPGTEPLNRQETGDAETRDCSLHLPLLPTLTSDP